MNKDENKTAEATGAPEFRDTTKKFDSDKTVTRLTGSAPEQHNPTPVGISGTITAPSRFLNRRAGEFDQKKAHCLASLNEGKLQLVVNEQSVTDKYTITGQIALGKLFVELGINTEKGYGSQGLAKKLKFMRSIFESHSEHTKLITQLRNLEAKINQQVENKKDDGGNRSLVFRQTVESNMPDSFTISLPLIEGEEPVGIEVSVILAADNGSIICYLESLEAADIIDAQREKIINDEVEKIEKDVLVVFY